MNSTTSRHASAMGASRTEAARRDPATWGQTGLELVRVVWQTAWLQRRSKTIIWTVAVFLLQFALRGGFSLAPAGVAWPYPPGTVITGAAPEPYLFAVVTPRVAITLALWSMVKWLLLAASIGFAVVMMQEAACCPRPVKAGAVGGTACCAGGSSPSNPRRQRTGTAGTSGMSGLVGGLVAVAGAAASCCGLLAVAAPAVAGLLGASLVSISPVLDAVVMVCHGRRDRYQGAGHPGSAVLRPGMGGDSGSERRSTCSRRSGVRAPAPLRSTTGAHFNLSQRGDNRQRATWGAAKRWGNILCGCC